MLRFCVVRHLPLPLLFLILLASDHQVQQQLQQAQDRAAGLEAKVAGLEAALHQAQSTAAAEVLIGNRPPSSFFFSFVVSVFFDQEWR